MSLKKDDVVELVEKDDNGLRYPLQHRLSLIIFF